MRENAAQTVFKYGLFSRNVFTLTLISFLNFNLFENIKLKLKILIPVSLYIYVNISIS